MASSKFDRFIAHLVERDNETERESDHQVNDKNQSQLKSKKTPRKKI